MIKDSKKLGAILANSGYVAEEDIKTAQDIAHGEGSQFVDYLLTQNLITVELLHQAIAEHFNVPYFNLKIYPPSKENVEEIPEEMAKKYEVVIVKKEEGVVQVATSDPTQTGLLSDLASTIKDGSRIELNYGATEDIKKTFIHYQKALSIRLTDLFLTKGEIVAPQIFDEILNDATFYKASDIHIEPQEEDVIIRFRIDGILHETGRIPRQFFENLLNHIKVQAHLKIDEHFSAQDGALHYSNEDEKIDMRISIVPVLDGEKVVIRLLSKYAQKLTLNDLGFFGHEQEILMNNAKKPYGMILVTGPTGSGKSTTLYSILKKINSPELNISTIEDPVEYKIQGVNHIQVNEQTNLTFAQGLKSIVRQDPDIILVGEIRDRETAEIGVNAALTGHLLFSTFHANDAATAIPRLLDMGTEPFLLASTLELILAQRLVRRICGGCRISEKVPVKDLCKMISEPEKYFKQALVTLYKGKGCRRCNNTGYDGRIGIFEFLEVTSDIKDLILNRPSKKELWEAARKNGALSMFENGIEKVRNGVTTLEELLRVTSKS